MGCEWQDLGERHGAEWSGRSQRAGCGNAHSLRWNGCCGEGESPPVSQVYPRDDKGVEERKQLSATAKVEVLLDPAFLRFSQDSFLRSRFSRTRVFHKSRDIGPQELGTLDCVSETLFCPGNSNKAA